MGYDQCLKWENKSAGTPDDRFKTLEEGRAGFRIHATCRKCRYKRKTGGTLMVKIEKYWRVLANFKHWS